MLNIYLNQLLSRFVLSVEVWCASLGREAILKILAKNSSPSGFYNASIILLIILQQYPRSRFLFSFSLIFHILQHFRHICDRRNKLITHFIACRGDADYRCWPQ